MSLHTKLGDCHPKLSRGMVWCRECGRSQRVNSGEAIQNGWPKCCSYTMTIDSPAERGAKVEANSAEVGGE